MISRASPQPTRYLFVDAGHLRANFERVTQLWCGTVGEFNPAQLRSLFGVQKVFYYDSIDDAVRPGESDSDYAARIDKQERFFREVSSVYATHVRLGSISGTGKKRRQKEVDILIAVDAMNHAVRQNMDHVILLTGDRDFTPLVETLVQLGLIVEVAGDLHFTSDALKEAADHYRPLTLNSYLQLMPTHGQRAVPAGFSLTSQPANRPDDERRAQGHIGQYDCVLFQPDPEKLLLSMTRREHAMHVWVARDELARLKLFLQLEHGDASWLPERI
jgi:uncharacterized LabA/DUF88 family protein